MSQTAKNNGRSRIRTEPLDVDGLQLRAVTCIMHVVDESDDFMNERPHRDTRSVCNEVTVKIMVENGSFFEFLESRASVISRTCAYSWSLTAGAAASALTLINKLSSSKSG